MNIDDLAIKSANTQRGGLVPSSTGLTPDALPEVQKNSFGRELKHRGTTKNALSGTGNDHSSASKTEDSRLSGNFWLVSFKISYLCLPLFYEPRTTPSCHPSGCAYRQL